MASDQMTDEIKSLGSPAAAPVEPEKRKPEELHKEILSRVNAVNIADDLEDDVLSDLGSLSKREYEIDVESRHDWMDKTEQAMKLAMQTTEIKQYPWPGASNVIYPLMTTAAVQFAARAYPAIVNGRNVVKGVVIGDDQGIPAQNPQAPGQPLVNPQTGQPMWIVEPGEKTARASRIGEHMSWQLLDEQPEWEEETDKLLHILPIVGCAFRKTYFDSARGRNVSVLVTAQRIVINYYAKSLETAPRITEELMLYPLEVEEMERAGIFKKIDYPSSATQNNDPDAPREFLEQHRWYDLDKDGYPEPYVVTVHKESAQVVRIVARYDADGVHVDQDGDVGKIEPIHYYTKYDFLPNPDGGIYGVGFGQLLQPINRAVNTTLNMMIDAGHLQVVGGGFIGKGLSMHTGNVRFTPGEFKAINATGGTIKDNIVPLETQGPSTVLFQLLGMLIEAGKEISAVKDVLTGEQKDANMPATTVLALIEQGLKTFTGIYKRVYRSLKKELEKLYRLNRIYLSQNAGYRVNNEWRNITRQDYQKGNGVDPVSDPTMVSDMQKMARAQFLAGFLNDPWFNGRMVRHRILSAASIEKIDEILVQQPPPNPELVKNAAELETRAERTRAEATKDYAQAILALAQADKTVGDAHLAWIEQQIEVYKARMDALNGVKKDTGEGGGRGGVPDLEASPRIEAHSPVPPGLSREVAHTGLGALGGQPPGQPGPGIPPGVSGPSEGGGGTGGPAV